MTVGVVRVAWHQHARQCARLGDGMARMGSDMSNFFPLQHMTIIANFLSFF
jgi:hypothetical protein